MIIDVQNRFSDAQALTATAASTDILDLGIDRNIGIGEPMSVVVLVDVAADDADANETYLAALESASDAAFTSPVELGRASIAAGSAAGSQFVIPLAADSRADRYIRLNYTLGGTTPSVTLSAFMVPTSMVDAYVKYEDNITIS